MKPVKPPRINGRVPVLSAQEAVNYIPDEATLCADESPNDFGKNH
ncbi:putative CoA transferase [Escherichia coli]|nr:putative CoA transferase [Escherichia coli]SQR07766.1 putative CoA transferase [Escherichia coli]